MTLPARLALATKNPGKIREILEICADWPVEWLTADGTDWPDIEETGATYRDNALLKAREVARVLGVPAVADDSGIEVDALGGAPGVRTRRYAGPDATDEENNLKLLEELGDLPMERRRARYRCVLAFLDPRSQLVGGRPWVMTRSGTLEGRIAMAPRGSGGFGYDPIFEPLSELGSGRTVGDYTAEEKNRVSHRARAARAMARYLKKRYPNQSR
jgi:XTP/dITP diphosphohydrolase